jgi:hypothetical protein
MSAIDDYKDAVKGNKDTMEFLEHYPDRAISTQNSRDYGNITISFSSTNRPVNNNPRLTRFLAKVVEANLSELIEKAIELSEADVKEKHAAAQEEAITLGYTLITLRAAREALLNNDKAEALRRINCLVSRMETIINTRKAWRPTCLKTKENEDGNNGSTEIKPEESPGEQRHSSRDGLLQMGQCLRHLAPKDRESPAGGENPELHHGGEPA